MRFLSGAAVALVLVGTALAAPDLAPVDPSLTDLVPLAASGELPVAARRPAARLVPHRLEGGAAKPAGKPIIVKKAVPAKGARPVIRPTVKVKPTAGKTTAKKPVAAKKPIAAKAVAAGHARMQPGAKPKGPMVKSPAVKGAAVKKAVITKAPVKAVGAKPNPKHPALVNAHPTVKPHPVAKVAAIRKPALAGAKSPVKRTGLAPVAKHAAAPKAKPLPVKRIAVKPIAKPIAGKPPVTKVAAKKIVPKKAAPKKAVVVRMGVPKAERGAVQAKYDAMSHLIMRRDGARLATLFMGMTTPDFVYRDKKGKALNRVQLVGQLKAQMKMVRAFKQSSNKVVGFGLKGVGGVAQIVSQFAMVFPNGKKSVSVAGQSVTSDTWVKTPKGWKLRAIRTLRESVKYNGKSV